MHSNKDIVHLLKSVAAAYTLTGAIRFRVIAYEKAADAIEHLTQEVYDVWQNGHLKDVDGIGPSLQEHLDEYFKNPKNSYLEKQLSKIPAPTYELMRAPGIGPKKAYRIVKEFDLTNPATVFEDVKKIAADHRIAKLEGFGEKSEKDILKAIGIYEERGQKEERMTLPTATQLARDVMAHLSQNKHVKKSEALGSFRRKAPTIGDIDIVVVCEPEYAKEVLEHFRTYPGTLTVETKGDIESSIMVTGGKRVDVRIISENQYGSMLQYFTGNKAHNIKLREFALKKGYSLNEFGIKEVKTGKVHTFETEEAFYQFLGVPWIPPEIREGSDEIKHALVNDLPQVPTIQDIKGEFHVHSSFDVVPSHDLGADSIEDMAAEAYRLGYQYLALSEHNPAMGKLSTKEIIEIVKNKAEAIKKIKTPVHLFNSLEIDIQPDGTLALPDEAFQYLDMCVVSIHSSFTQSREAMTKRILKALSYPKVKVIGHPTGRLLGKREEIEADWDAIFDVCKEKHIALEINSSHERLDLPEGLVKRAVENGNSLVIDTDSHAASHMDSMEYGIYVARRGWAEKSDIINTYPLDHVIKWITG